MRAATAGAVVPRPAPRACRERVRSIRAAPRRFLKSSAPPALVRMMSRSPWWETSYSMPGSRAATRTGASPGRFASTSRTSLVTWSCASITRNRRDSVGRDVEEEPRVRLLVDERVVRGIVTEPVAEDPARAMVVVELGVEEGATVRRPLEGTRAPLDHVVETPARVQVLHAEGCRTPSRSRRRSSRTAGGPGCGRCPRCGSSSCPRLPRRRRAGSLRRCGCRRCR